MYTKENPRTNRQKPETDLTFEFTHASFGEIGENKSFEKKPFIEKKQGRLPAMGWNSWNAFGTKNTSALTKAMADRIVELGLDKLGYKYVVLDDGCYASKRENGKLVSESVKFPEGFMAMSDYIHSKGLKFGMYNDIGPKLCSGTEVGTCGFEDVDAQSYIDWKIDFLKVDNCYYLWDNATFSDAENARYTYAPNIRGIRIENAERNVICKLDAVKDGILTGLKAQKTDEYVTNIGTFDGTNTGTTQVGPRYGELLFKVTVSEDGRYNLIADYACGKKEGVGQWLQVAVGSGKDEKLYFDDLLKETKSETDFKESEGIPLELKKGENIIRLMNHRRQENVLCAYGAMFYALKKAKPDNDIVFSICEWGKTHPQNWGFKVGDSWRILNDITFCVGSDKDNGKGEWGNPGTQSIASQYNKAVVMDEFSGLDKGWNDPDMLVIGMNGISNEMAKTHMAMWCMMNSPLMLGLDLRRVKKGDEIYNIISNKDLIDLNQDKLGIQAKRIWTSLGSENPDKDYITDNNRFDILAKPLSDGSVAVSLFNMSEKEKSSATALDFSLIEKKLGSKMPKDFMKAKSFAVKNLWTKDESVINSKNLTFEPVLPCANITLKITSVFE